MQSYVALRKESVDRNIRVRHCNIELIFVALRKESVDRNNAMNMTERNNDVALRKESVDRNRSFHQQVVDV